MLSFNGIYSVTKLRAILPAQVNKFPNEPAVCVQILIIVQGPVAQKRSLKLTIVV